MDNKYKMENYEMTEDNDVIEPKRVDLDTILVEEIGQFGLYQFRTLALSAIVVIFIGWANTQYVFTSARIPTRCLIPECESPDQKDFRPAWIEHAIPRGPADSFDNCRRFVSAHNFSRTDACPAHLFNRSLSEHCKSYVYENTNSVVYDYDMACDEWRRSLIGSVRTFGTLVAHPITGYVSDRWGRRTAMIVNAVNAAWVGTLRYWANTYLGFTMSQFAEAALGFGGFSCAYIMAMELVGPKFRVAAAASMSTSFAIGQVTLALIAWGVPNWRDLTLTLYVPQFITITYFWLISESARWYMSKGLYEKSEQVLKDVARVNKKMLSDKSLMALRVNSEEEKRRVAAEAKSGDQPGLITLVFRHKSILIRVLVSPVWWITAMCVYYGLTINAVNMVGNQYLNMMAVAAVEIPGFWMAVLLTNKIGRKPTVIGAYWVCAACMVAYIFTPSDLYGASLTVYLIGKCSISTVMTSIYVYTAELYPTKYRHSLFAFASMMGRIGSIAAPLTPALGNAVFESLPFVIFACLAFLSGALVFITPETRGTKFPDTMEEAEHIGQTKQAA